MDFEEIISLLRGLFEVRTLSTMATTTSSVLLIGSPFLPQSFRASTINTQITPSPWFSKMKIQRFRLRTRRNLVLRCARTESKGVSFGFRPPNFEVLNPNSVSKQLKFIPNFQWWQFVFGWPIGLASRTSYRQSMEIGRLWTLSCFTGKIRSHFVQLSLVLV